MNRKSEQQRNLKENRNKETDTYNQKGIIKIYDTHNEEREPRNFNTRKTY